MTLGKTIIPFLTPLLAGGYAIIRNHYTIVPFMTDAMIEKKASGMSYKHGGKTITEK